ncbi:hypothetical protein LOAG_06432 [Loa loa]|uniref:Potassium channel domain-containing protein n=1 Tax=Loa loa TaxID=7209 RepID=A0A1S0TXQ2_LOALO|nr:hypothetical protein LOAG_06432 [Loa loa]EFO22055.2 hypothetical protein LOAG_06432 [Loa loa]
MESCTKSKDRMNEEHEFNETKEIESSFCGLFLSNEAASRKKFLPRRSKELAFISTEPEHFKFSELTASQEAERGNAQIESCHRKRLFELLPVETFVFRNAMLYSFGVYTTIGYGNLFPRTVQGRILTVVYAVVGIPLNVAFISDLGELVSRTVKRALHCFQRRILNK